MIEVITWKWRREGYRSTFGADAVNTMQRMLARHLHAPHRVSCVTDDPTGIDPAVRVIDISSLPSHRWMNVRNPSGDHQPSCYVRLFLFSPEAAEVFGERIVSVDLDMVLTGDVTPILDNDHEFAIWGGQSILPRRHGARVYNWYNGSLMSLRAGARSQVWEDFKPNSSPVKAHRAGCRGSDQGWIAYKLGHSEHTWGAQDGVYSFRGHVRPSGGLLPDDARIVAFHGAHDPWDADVRRNYRWVQEHYR